ncbi:MAG: hypothetical protein ABI767_06810, partial [Rhodanobacter sp.]
ADAANYRRVEARASPSVRWLDERHPPKIQMEPRGARQKSLDMIVSNVVFSHPPQTGNKKPALKAGFLFWLGD